MKIIGHPHPLRYLTSALEQNRLSPSLLFVGPDGVGKRTVALELAKALGCRSPQKSQNSLPVCDHCSHCQRVGSNHHPDVLYVNRLLQATLLKEKPESQTAIKIESVRHLDKFLRLKSLELAKRVAIIAEADKMTNEAANALLKILEEPPASAQIILLAVDSRNLSTTILSRCAVVRFQPLPAPLLSNYLEREYSLAENVAAKVSALSGGSISKAVTLKDSEPEEIDLSAFALDEFFSWLAEPSWKKEGRARAEKLLTVLTENALQKLDAGDLSQTKRIEVLLGARRQIDRHVPARLVLENLYLALEPAFKK